MRVLKQKYNNDDHSNDNNDNNMITMIIRVMLGAQLASRQVDDRSLAGGFGVHHSFLRKYMSV